MFSGFEGGLAAFLLFLFIYQGELGGFMQNSQVFFVKFYKHWWKYGMTGVFGVLGAIAIVRFPDDPAGVQTPAS